MKPIRSNSQKETCSPISSNCIVWQGPDLSCISLCNGDSISDVTYKLAEEVCQLKQDLGLSDIELTCLVQVCQTTPEPTKTLSNILTLLVNKVCCLSDIVENIPDPGTPYVEPTLSLPPCLRYPNGTGGFTTELILSQYVQRVATFLCELNEYVRITQGGQIATLQAQVTALENAVPVVPQISSCLLGTIEDVAVVVEELEQQFCDYKVVLGSVPNINTSLTRQCTGLTGATPSLATGNPMSVDFPGWKTTVQNLADSLSNLWFTVCDIRSAVKIIQSSCCKVDCESIIVDFDYKWVDEFTLKAYFTPKTTVPLGFWDCNDTDGNEFTFTDGLGNSYSVFIHFRRQNPTDLTGVLDDIVYIANGYPIDLSLSPLDTTTGITITSNVCFTNGDISCVKCFTKTIVPYINKDCCTLTSSTTNTIVYKVCISS